MSDTTPDSKPEAPKAKTTTYILKVIVCFLTFGFIFSNALNG